MLLIYDLTCDTIVLLASQRCQRPIIGASINKDPEAGVAKVALFELQ